MMAFGNQTITFLDYILFFLAGALLANGVPHFVAGHFRQQIPDAIRAVYGTKEIPGHRERDLGLAQFRGGRLAPAFFLAGADAAGD